MQILFYPEYRLNRLKIFSISERMNSDAIGSKVSVRMALRAWYFIKFVEIFCQFLKMYLINKAIFC